jgi:hypothetical protein
MADRLFNLPEFRSQIIGCMDNNALSQTARVSKVTSLEAFMVLYRNLDSPWPLIQLLLEPTKRAATPADIYQSPNPRDGFVCISCSEHIKCPRLNAVLL